MKPDLEQENQNSKLGHRENHGIRWIEQADNRFSEDYPGDELAYDSGLADALSYYAQQLRRYEKCNEHCEKVRERMLGHRRVKKIPSGPILRRCPCVSFSVLRWP
jgi:hypothetical protein